MKKILSAACLASAALALSSCTLTEGAYTPVYTNDYIYSVGYYGYRPHWNNNQAWATKNHWQGQRGYHHGRWAGQGRW